MAKKYIFPLIVQVLLCSCKPNLPDTVFSLNTPRAAYRLNIPFVPQEKEDYCGPAALTMVLNYWKDKVDQHQIADTIYLSSVKGTLSFDLVNYAKERGFNAELYSGSFQDLKEKIVSGYPLIVVQGYQKNVPGHYMVLVGYDDRKQQVIAHDGKSAYVSTPYRKFFLLWSNMDRLTILITP